MTSENKFWPSKKKKDRVIEGALSFEQLEAFAEDYLRSVGIIRPNEEVLIDFPMYIERDKPVAVAITIKQGGA